MTEAPSLRRTGVGGLCALAILAVMLHHAWPGLLPGGFAGIDVLFVVAGYLAASRISREMAEGRFSLTAFWGLHLRRHAPALIALLCVTALAAWTARSAGGLADFSLTLAASAAFLGNFAFAAMAGIFGPGPAAQPLWHLWAVGVGAQFLLVFPLIVLAAERLAPRRVALILILLTVASYWMAVWGVNADPDRAWHMPHMRLWEFLFGALLVYGELPEMSGVGRRAGIAAIGLVTVLVSFTVMQESLRVPGVATIAPVLGASLAVYAGASGPNPVTRLLSAAPLALIGAAGYSLYLWHWPALLAARDLLPGPIAPAAGLAAAAVIGGASYWWLERPFHAATPGRRRATALSALGLAALFALGVFGVAA